MKRKRMYCILLLGFVLCHPEIEAQSFTLESITGYPFISEINATSKGNKIVVSLNQKGIRNVYTAEGPAFKWNKITGYDTDEGQEITSATLSPDGNWVVYVRGGDHGAFDHRIIRNPSSLAEAAKINVYSIPFKGGKPILLGEGDMPIIDEKNNGVLFIKNGQVWKVPIDGSKQAAQLFTTKGSVSDLQLSPDGSKVLFVASRGAYSFIGIFSGEDAHIHWVAPSFARDLSPRWAPDGSKIVFIRRPSAGGEIDSITVKKHVEWSIWTADISSGASKQIWKAPATLAGSVPSSSGRFNLHWAAKDRIIFLSYQDGWPHLYSLPVEGGEPLLLTPGAFNAEQVVLSPDKQWLAFAVNKGNDKDDYDRRHIARVRVDVPGIEMLTQGKGIESTPVFFNGGKDLFFLSATAIRPTLPAWMPFDMGKLTLTGEDLVAKDFPVSQLVEPRSIKFKAPDGNTVYGQVFFPEKIKGKAPAVLFIHGGPQRQMLLGWHYMDYYANTYAVNQYLAHMGFVVLSVNYRLGIGYGYTFQNPSNSGRLGASEYQDIKAAGQWLAAQPMVDPKRIGVYGGSYGGFLTAMALAKDSRIFAAGVDISGMHNFLLDFENSRNENAPDFEYAKKLAWQSSPDAYLKTWTSPVLIISGDDDGNVPVGQSLDIINRFREKGFPYESIAFPDETHHWMKYENMYRMDSAIVEFLDRKLKRK